MAVVNKGRGYPPRTYVAGVLAELIDYAGHPDARPEHPILLAEDDTVQVEDWNDSQLTINCNGVTFALTISIPRNGAGTA